MSQWFPPVLRILRSLQIENATESTLPPVLHSGCIGRRRSSKKLVHGYSSLPWRGTLTCRARLPKLPRGPTGCSAWGHCAGPSCSGHGVELERRAAQRAGRPPLREHAVEAPLAELVAARGDDHLSLARQAGVGQTDRTARHAPLDGLIRVGASERSGLSRATAVDRAVVACRAPLILAGVIDRDADVVGAVVAVGCAPLGRRRRDTLRLRRLDDAQDDAPLPAGRERAHLLLLRLGDACKHMST